MRGEGPPDLAGILLDRCAVAARNAEVLEPDALAVEHPEHVVIRRDEQRRSVGERRVVGEPLRIGVAVRAHDRQVLHRRVEAAGERARRRVGREEPVRMEIHGYRHGGARCVVPAVNGRLAWFGTTSAVVRDRPVSRRRQVRRQRLAHAVAPERLDVARHGAAEGRVRREIVAEHRGEVQESRGEARGVAARALRDRGEGRRHRIGHRDRLAGLVGAARVADPAGDRERQVRVAAAARQPVAHRVEQPLRQLLRAVHRDLLGAVRQRGVAEAHQQHPRVGVEVDACRRDHRRDDLLGHLPLDEPCELRIGRRLPDGLEAGEEAQVGERRMAAVQQPQLHRLERSDVVGELGADGLPRRSLGREAVLDHPLPERLGHDRHRVVDAEEARRLGDVGRRGRRHDPVDHRARERHVTADPVGERRVDGLRERADHALDQVPVVRKVVAADDGDGAAARRAPRGEPGDQHAGRRDRQRGLRAVVDDVRVRGIELARRRVVAVALLGHRHRHHLDRRVGEARHQPRAVGAEEERLAQRPDHAGPNALAALLQHRVQPVLGIERVDGQRRRQVHAADSPARIGSAADRR